MHTISSALQDGKAHAIRRYHASAGPVLVVLTGLSNLIHKCSLRGPADLLFVNPRSVEWLGSVGVSVTLYGGAPRERNPRFADAEDFRGVVESRWALYVSSAVPERTIVLGRVNEGFRYEVSSKGDVDALPAVTVIAAPELKGILLHYAVLEVPS